MKALLLGMTLLLAGCRTDRDSSYLPEPARVDLTVTPVDAPGTVAVTVRTAVGTFLPTEVLVHLLDGSTVVQTVDPGRAVPVTSTPDAPFTFRYDVTVSLDPTRSHVLSAVVSWTRYEVGGRIRSAPQPVPAGSF